MLLDEIAGRIEAIGHASTSSTNAWFLARGDLPDAEQGSTLLGDRVVALIETPGGPPSPRPSFQDAGFQLLVRGESITSTEGAYVNARAQIARIDADLNGFGGDLSSVHYIGIWGQQTPFFGGYDQRQRPIFICNYRALRATTSS